jgi:hypothetical protein
MYGSLVYGKKHDCSSYKKYEHSYDDVESEDISDDEEDEKGMHVNEVESDIIVLPLNKDTK